MTSSNQPSSSLPTGTSTPEVASAARALQQAFFERVLSRIQSPVELLPELERAFPATDLLPAQLLQLDELKRCLDIFRPLHPGQMEKLQQAWDTEYTYESNRIEGNTLTLRETSLVINDGITVGGKSMREHLEAINHRDAIRLMREYAAGTDRMNQAIFLRLHRVVLRSIDEENAGFFRRGRVSVTGSARVFPNPVKVPDLIATVFDAFNSEVPDTHPLVQATMLHHQLVHVHPFVDGNGRTARLMQNLVLLRNGFVVANLKGEVTDRLAYYDALAQADNGQMQPLCGLLYKVERQALMDHLSMVCGEIGENADIDGRGVYFYEKMLAQTNS